MPVSSNFQMMVLVAAGQHLHLEDHAVVLAEYAKAVGDVRGGGGELHILTRLDLHRSIHGDDVIVRVGDIDHLGGDGFLPDLPGLPGDEGGKRDHVDEDKHHNQNVKPSSFCFFHLICLSP